MTKGASGPAAFKVLLAELADYFDRAPRGAALETLQKFGVRTETPFSSYLHAFRVVVASTVAPWHPPQTWRKNWFEFARPSNIQR